MLRYYRCLNDLKFFSTLFNLILFSIPVSIPPFYSLCLLLQFFYFTIFQYQQQQYSARNSLDAATALPKPRPTFNQYKEQQVEQEEEEKEEEEQEKQQKQQQEQQEQQQQQQTTLFVCFVRGRDPTTTTSCCVRTLE